MGVFYRLCLLTFVGCLSLAAPLEGQSATAQPRIWVPSADTLQELTLRDGTSLVGRITDAGDPIRFELLSGATVELQLSQVVHLRAAEGIVRDGQLWRRDASGNRMFFGPTGSTIRQGEGYFAVFEVVFPAVGFGITDRFSIAGGTLLLGGIDDSRPVWLIPKLHLIDEESFDFSVGALAITTFDDHSGTVGVLFGVGTWGSENASVTAGAGWGWVDDDFASTPAILLGGDVRLTRNIKLMTENYWIPTGSSDDVVILAAGPRFMGDRLSADIALAISPEGGEFFPLVNFVWHW